ncbi:acyl-CoA thioesterase [Mycobacteroides franklinii]|uniref:acyl-CoA thioesterase n=1 Tax=Mycobacteroides franklinii TaxID=948102 RepID=UPI0012FFC93F|nr:acyl-CoA thioesterase [Mycobacteroides franklinii]
MSATLTQVPVQERLRPQQSWFTIEHRVTAGDTSAVGPVYYARLIDWQGQCREQCGQLGAPVFSSDISGDYVMLTQSCSCEFIAELHFGDLVAIRLTVPWVRMHLMKGEYRFERISVSGEKGGELVAKGEQIWASARHVDGRMEPCPWPRELVDCVVPLGADVSRAQIEDSAKREALDGISW